MAAGQVQGGAQQPRQQSAGLGQSDPLAMRPRPGEHLGGQVRGLLGADATNEQPVDCLGVPVVEGVERLQLTAQQRSPQLGVGERSLDGGGVSHAHRRGQGQGPSHTCTSALTPQRCIRMRGFSPDLRRRRAGGGASGRGGGPAATGEQRQGLRG